jgi:hypothetical protein
MSKHLDPILYRGQIIARSKSGYYLKPQDHPLTLLQFTSLEEAKDHIDSMLAKDEVTNDELRDMIRKVANNPDLLAKLAKRDAELAKKVVEVARLCRLLKEEAAS